MMWIILLAAMPFAVKALTLGMTGYVLQSLYKVVQLLIPVGWRWAHGETFNEPRPTRSVLLLGILVAVLGTGIAIVAVLLVTSLFQLNPATIRMGFDTRFAVSGSQAFAVVVFLSVINSALEELHFRYWLDAELSRRAGTTVGIAVSALAFGCMHGFIVLGLPDIPSMLIIPIALGIALMGACWSGLMRYPGGIYAAWLSHALTDVLLLTWGLFWLGYF